MISSTRDKSKAVFCYCPNFSTRSWFHLPLFSCVFINSRYILCCSNGFSSLKPYFSLLGNCQPRSLYGFPSSSSGSHNLVLRQSRDVDFSGLSGTLGVECPAIPPDYPLPTQYSVATIEAAADAAAILRSTLNPQSPAGFFLPTSSVGFGRVGGGKLQLYTLIFHNG
jgi:hypothetical protein